MLKLIVKIGYFNETIYSYTVIYKLIIKSPNSEKKKINIGYFNETTYP